MREDENTEDVHEAAAVWAVRVDAGLSASERIAFTAWIEADPSHAEVFAKVAAVVHAEFESAADAGLSQALPFARALTSGMPRWRYPAFAAAGLALAILLALPFIELNSSGRRDFDPAWSTQIAEIRDSEMSDGSRLWVDAQTDLGVAYTDQDRVLRLERGGVFVDVEPDVDRPLSVETPAFTFTALGTAFEVQARGGEYLLSVEHGTVRIAAAANDFIRDVEAGSRARWTPAHGWVFDTIDPGGVAAWRDGRVRFANARLADVVTVLNRYGQSRILVRSESLAEQRVTGVFSISEEDQAVMRAALAATVDARELVTSDGNVILVPNRNSND